MTSKGFEPAIPGIKQPQTSALDHTATGMGLKDSRSRSYLPNIIYVLLLKIQVYLLLFVDDWRDVNLSLTTRQGVGSRHTERDVQIAGSVAVITVKNCQECREKEEVKELKYVFRRQNVFCAYEA